MNVPCPFIYCNNKFVLLFCYCFIVLFRYLSFLYIWWNILYKVRIRQWAIDEYRWFIAALWSAFCVYVVWLKGTITTKSSELINLFFAWLVLLLLPSRVEIVFYFSLFFVLYSTVITMLALLFSSINSLFFFKVCMSVCVWMPVSIYIPLVT